MKLLQCLIYLLTSGVIIFFCGRFFSRKLIKEKRFPFKSFRFEKKGKIYEKLKIKKWKTKLPDASLILNKIFPKIMPKKRIDEVTKEKINVLIKESCVAETTHILAGLFGLLCIKIWKGLGGTLISIIYFIWNALFVMIQRYNRPRLIETINKF